MLQRNDVCVWILYQLSHDLEFAVFESLVLQYLFDRNYLVRLYDLCLKNNTKTSISNDSFRRVANILRPAPLRG